MGTFSVHMVMRGRFYCVVNIKSTVESLPHHHLHAKKCPWEAHTKFMVLVACKSTTTKKEYEIGSIFSFITSEFDSFPVL